VTYVKRDGKVERQEKPSVSGLVFVQGVPDDIKSFLKDELPHHFLSNDCSTKRTAVIRDSEMRFFMQTMEVEPTRIRFLEKPFEYYGRYYPQIQMTSGPFAGKKGFIVRIHRDRHFVMQFGNIAIAVSGIHKESFVNAPTAQMKQASLEHSDELKELLN
jgi:transcription antitermination factor NusG